MFLIWWTRYGLLAIVIPIAIALPIYLILRLLFLDYIEEDFFMPLFYFVFFGLSSIFSWKVGRSLNSKVTRVVINEYTGQLTKDFHTLYRIKVEYWGILYGIICSLSFLVLLEQIFKFSLN